jgi:hypothetical protein
MYFRQALAGSVTLPDFAALDPDIPGRSAALGQPILAGQTRSYQVSYRDGIVVGGCAPALTFNVSSGMLVTWY